MLHENIAREEAQLQKLARVGTPQAIQLLRQYAQTHQDDAIRLSLANQAVNDAKEMHSKALAMLSGQQPPTVAQQVVQSIGGQGGAPMPPAGGPQAPMPPQGMPPAPPPGMQMPPPAPPAPQMPPPSGQGATPQGIAGLPAQNIQNMADGGIAGYADGGEIRMAGGGFDEDAIRAQLRSLKMPEPLIESAVQRERMAAENAQQQKQLPFTPATTSVVSPNQVTGKALTGPELWAGQEPMGAFIARGISNLIPGRPREEYDIGANRAKEMPMVQAQVAQQREKMSGIRNVAPPSAEEYATLPGVARMGAESPASFSAPPTPKAYTPPQQSVPVPSGLARLLNPEKMSVEEAKAAASGLNNSDQIQALLSTRGAEHKALLDELERRRAELIKPLEKPEETAGAKYIAKQREELAGDRETMKSQALIDVGLAIASGRSGRALVNIADGLSKGNEMYKSALKEFKAAGKDIDKMQLLESERRKAEEQGRDKDAFAYAERIAGLKEQHAESTMKTMVDKLGIDAKVASDMYMASQANARSDIRTATQVQAQMAEANARLNQLPEQARFAMLLGGGDVKTGLQVMQDIKNSPMEVYMALTQATASYNKNLPVGETPIKSPSMAEVANLMRESRAYQNMPNPVDVNGKLPSSMLMSGGAKAGPLADEIKRALTPGPKTVTPPPGYNLYGYGR
jgi:hypothetical protein